MLLNASEEEKVAIKQLQQEKNKELRLKKAESIKQARTHFERDFICEKAALLAVLDTASTGMESQGILGEHVKPLNTTKTPSF